MKGTSAAIVLGAAALVSAAYVILLFLLSMMC
jgi:hypothetical protein